MALSMTGYGRGEQLLHGQNITVEIRSVNSRYFEFSSRVPRGCAFMEDRLKKLLNSQISRGKVELGLQLQSVEASDTVVQVNLPLARQYRDAMRTLYEELEIKDDLTTGLIARFPDVLVTSRAQVDQEQLWQDVSQVTGQALEAFLEMRRVEGRKLKEDLLEKLKQLEADVAWVEGQSEGRVEAYTQRLYEKLKVLLEDRNIEESRILTEAAIFGDKTAVDEETVRLHSHIQQYRDVLESPEPVGRKLDFLTQEMNRETNTIGSKCQDVQITKRVVEMKACIEKIREQVQNLE